MSSKDAWDLIAGELAIFIPVLLFVIVHFARKYW